jgi:DNA-binding CsgD family transcriptional regulator
MARKAGGARRTPRAEPLGWPLVGRAREVSRLKDSLRQRRGAVITGPAGVGKTALARVGVDFAHDEGMAVAMVAGTEAARPHPFGAFASLLHHEADPLGPESHAEMLRRYTHELVDDARRRPLLVFVDDAHLLDDGSSMLVHQLAQTGAATVLACVLPPGAASPGPSDPIVALWKDLGAERIELGPLDEQAVEDLLIAVLGGPVDDMSVRQIAERSLGDPLFVHELVAGAVAEGALRDESGVWRLRGSLRPTTRLVELVTRRLVGLTASERDALELTAIGEPLAQPALDELADPTALESLESKGLIVCRVDGRRLQVCLAHPVYGDVVRAAMSARRERALAQALADASRARRRDDALLVASLRLVGGGGNAELLLAGAQAARDRRDPVLTERLARAAMESGAGFEARLLAAEAAHTLGRHEQAETELAALARDAADTTDEVRVALLRFDHALYLRGRADVSTVDALLAQVDDPPWRDELLARRFRLLALAEGPRAVIESAGPPAHPPPPHTSLHTVLGDCLTRSGQLHRGLTLLRTSRGSGGHRWEWGPPEPWSSVGSRGLALVGLGRLGEAAALLGRARAEAGTEPGSLESAIVGASLGELRVEEGRVQSAFMLASGAAATFTQLGLPVLARRCQALSALSLALAGMTGKATEALAALDALGLPADMEYEVEVLGARAWTCAASGDMGGARKNLELAVELGRQTGDLLGATKALHGLARLGRARQVVDELSELASLVDGELTATRLAHARAAAAGDPGALQAAAARFEELGALLGAAEALGESAVHLRRAGSARDAAAAEQAAARLLARCEGAVTPFVQAIGARARLTPAELDTALQAAAGSTDKEIAEHMHLSVRTVENRLHRAYQKLGLTRRSELADALRDLPGV